MTSKQKYKKGIILKIWKKKRLLERESSSSAVKIKKYKIKPFFQDPLKSRNPDPPQLIKGTGGKTAQGGSTLHSFMAKQIAVKNKDDHIDPRERILRHAKVSFRGKNKWFLVNIFVKSIKRVVTHDN